MATCKYFPYKLPVLVLRAHRLEVKVEAQTHPPEAPNRRLFCFHRAPPTYPKP